MKIYVASSWKNTLQPEVITRLWRAGYDPYDFRNPRPGNNGFSWKQLGDGWEKWTPFEYVSALKQPIAEHGFTLDFNAMKSCDACLLLLPCGRSAHLEAGWFVGVGKPLVIVLDDRIGSEPLVPELMYKMAVGIAHGMDEAMRMLDCLEIAAPPSTVADSLIAAELAGEAG